LNGAFRAKITLANPQGGDLKPYEVDALADTRSLFLCLLEEVRLQLQSQSTSEKKQPRLMITPGG
jgi:hypothetical protein